MAAADPRQDGQRQDGPRQDGGSDDYRSQIEACLRDGASFLGAVEYSPVLTALQAELRSEAEREAWGIALENLYYGLLCLMRAEASATAHRPVALAEIRQASDRHHCGALFRDLLADFTDQADCRLARLSPGGRVTLLSLLLQALRVTYGALLDLDAGFDAEAMAELQVVLDGLTRRIAAHLPT